MEPIENVKVAVADGANDSNKNFEYSDDRHILPLIPVHINATGGSPHRKLRIEEQLGVIRRRGRNRNVIPPKEIRKKNQEKMEKGKWLPYAIYCRECILSIQKHVW